MVVLRRIASRRHLRALKGRWVSSKLSQPKTLSIITNEKSHLGHFLFTKLLLPILKATAAKKDSDVRIVTVRIFTAPPAAPTNLNSDILFWPHNAGPIHHELRQARRLQISWRIIPKLHWNARHVLSLCSLQTCQHPLCIRTSASSRWRKRPDYIYNS